MHGRDANINATAASEARMEADAIARARPNTPGAAVTPQGQRLPLAVPCRPVE